MGVSLVAKTEYQSTFMLSGSPLREQARSHISFAAYSNLVTFPRQKSRDKFLTACYVLFMKAGFHFSFIRARYARGTGYLTGPIQETSRGDCTMDDYQEELLEFQAFELDQPEAAEDATEL